LNARVIKIERGEAASLIIQQHLRLITWWLLCNSMFTANGLVLLSLH